MNILIGGLSLMFLVWLIWTCLSGIIERAIHSIEVQGRVVDFKYVDEGTYNKYIPIVEYKIDNGVYRNEVNFLILSKESMEKFDKDRVILLNVDRVNPNNISKSKHCTDGLFAGSYFGFLLGAFLFSLCFYCYYYTYLV